MRKLKRKLKKFLAVTLAASFLAQSGTTLLAAGVQKTAETTPANVVQVEPEELTSENETKQESVTDSETLTEEESSENETTEEITKEEESSSVQETTKEEESSSIQETTTEEESSSTQEIKSTEEVLFNTGKKVYHVVSKEDFFERELGDACFEEDDSYTIQIPEENPFFPYEVQFTYQGEVTNQWFLSPDDSIEIGGHTFYVSAYFDGTVVTQMSLNIAGDIVTVYPEEKEFVDEDGADELSLLPLEEIKLTVDLTSYTPVELTMVSLYSIFTGENSLKDTDKVVWLDGSQIINSGDIIDLKNNTSYSTYEMIVGDADQLNMKNIRYLVTVKTKESKDWLIPTLCVQDETGNRTNINILENNWLRDKLRTYVLYNDIKDFPQVYMKLTINPSIFPEPHFKSVKIYEGKYKSASEAISGVEITDQIYNADLSQIDTGYAIQRNKDFWITIVVFNETEQVIGCLPVDLYLYTRSNGIDRDLEFRVGTKPITIVYKDTSVIKDGCRYVTYTLYKEYAANGIYHQKLFYYKNGIVNIDYSSDVTAAYIGKYSSIAEATAANAKDIKESLFSEEGYPADYSQGVYVSIFVGNDEEEKQEIYQFCFKTETGKVSSYHEEIKEEIDADRFNDITELTFTGIKDSNGKSVPHYTISNSEDSYSEFEYLTVLVGEDVDLTQLAPQFNIYYGAKLYAEGSSSPEVSGESLHDFSKGFVQYTVSAESGRASKNYWLRILKANDETNELYINSLEDSSSHTEIKDNVIYSTREVSLDGYHNYQHDILLINAGKNSIPSLSVELTSDVIELNDYWTLHGTFDLLGFNDIEKTTDYGELQNLAKIRVQAKDDIPDGAKISGTLTIKSNDTTLMVLTLTGTVGDPCIVTKELPAAVKYVPYGTMIQNNNKYSWNQVSYAIEEGSLPKGMELRRNGELYGVPLESGEFPITLEVINSSSEFGSSNAELTLIVNDNTNANVYTASDEGYIIEQPIGQERGTYNYILNNTNDQLFVSSGEYGEFIALWLNGEKLVGGEDYLADSGSTRITIRSQTFENKTVSGSNTIAAEFRVGKDENKELKRTAQNFRLEVRNNNNNSSDDDDDSSDDNDSSSSNDESSSNSNSNVSENPNSNENVNQTDNPVTTDLIAYNDDSWIKDEAGWWCKNPDGSWLSNTWYQLPYRGTFEWYYFNNQGYMITGWFLHNNHWYYLNPVSDGTKGKMCIGWQFINNHWYYLNPISDGTKGKMYTGWQLINGKWYYFNEEGTLLTDTWIDNYYVNSDGVWIENP